MSINVIGVPDPRLVYDDNPTFAKYLSALKWEQYKIPASGLSNSSITFANLVTLGTNRVYSDTFEIEYTVTATFAARGPVTPAFAFPGPSSTVLRAFPLSTATSQIRANINGAACMTRPDTWMAARMRYWDQDKLANYLTTCPHQKPHLGNEPVGREAISNTQAGGDIRDHAIIKTFEMVGTAIVDNPSSSAANSNRQSDSTNWEVTDISYSQVKTAAAGDTGTMTFTVREPVMCAPFNSRLDHNYGRPLFNITSLDITYTLDSLSKMFIYPDYDLTCSSVNIGSAQLVFQVASLRDAQVPRNLLLPYYEHTPYITDIPSKTSFPAGQTCTIASGVYTLAQVPSAIYCYVGEPLSYLQAGSAASNSNRLFAPIDHVEITLGNNTQIMSTMAPHDLYRMCLANGLKNTPYNEFRGQACNLSYSGPDNESGWLLASSRGLGGACLRMVPGVDLCTPDKELIPGTAADNLVFQARVTFTPKATLDHPLSLWIIFEYSGTLNLSPGQGFIDMIPIKNAAAASSAANSQVASVPTDENGIGTNPSGAGIWDTIKNIGRKALGFAKDNKLISKYGKFIPGIGPAVSSVAEQMGYGMPGGAMNGGAMLGGACMSDGDFYN